MASCIALFGFKLESITAVPLIIELEEFERVCLRDGEAIERFCSVDTLAGSCLKFHEVENTALLPSFHTLLAAGRRISGGLAKLRYDYPHVFTNEALHWD